MTTDKRNQSDEPAAASTPRRKVVIAGFGPVGRVVVEMFEGGGWGVTIVELNLQTIEHQLGLDRHSIVFGDIRDPDIQRKAGVAQADALILTIPDECAAVAACEVARALSPNIFIAARTNYLSQGMLASQAGADEVVVEEVVTAQAMRHAVMDRFINGNGEGNRGKDAVSNGDTA